MAFMKGGLAVAAAGTVVVLAACSSSGAGGRAVDITQAESGCRPTTIQATPGEKLKLVVKNTSGKDYEVEGIDGTKLEELVVPSGKTRTPGYTVPDNGSSHKIKCYVPGGVSTIIDVQTSGAGTTPGASSTESAQAPAGAGTPVQVALADYSVKPDRASVAAGDVTFTATNSTSDHVHELAVLRPKADGSYENLGEIEDLAEHASGNLTLDLPAGSYVLACLIVPGEAGSTVDHFKQGMHTAFTVTGEE